MFRLLICLLLFSFNASALEVSSIYSIYDADTFRVNIDDWPPIIGYKMPIRVNGVDAPEMRGKCEQEKILARKAKQHTVDLLRSAKVVEIKNLKRGKYFRLIADVYVDGVSLAESLINNNLARVYNGGKRDGWC